MTLQYREMRADEADAVASMVAECFDRYVGSDFSAEGRAEFRRFSSAATIAGRMHDHWLLMALGPSQEVAGVIEIRALRHVSLLFVAESFQRRGIAAELMKRALARIAVEDPSLREVTVNSSLFAVRAYERFGFVADGPEQVTKGIRFVPMRRAVAKP